MNVVCSFSVTLKDQHSGFGLLECLITLVILSTSILMVMSESLRQIQRSREMLLLNQLYQEVDSLCLFVNQHEADAALIVDEWESQFAILFPQAKSHIHLTAKTLMIEIDIHPYTLKVIAHGMRSKKSLTRHDAR